ncbi:MAG: HEAT repeat domain-containing protein, partial [Pseudoalteromonas spongiae]
KLKYLNAKQDANLLDFATPKLHTDEFKLQLDHCGLKQLTGQNHTEVKTKSGDIKISVEQNIQFSLNPAPIPSAALLLSLDVNPLKWPQLSAKVLYPRPPAKPLKDAQTFIATLRAQDLAKLSSEALAQLLYDNEQCLGALKELIKSNSLSDKAMGRLLLMIGKNDSPNAHQILVDVYLDNEIQGKQRFRSLMGLKYAEQPLDPKLVDLVLESASQTSTGEQRRLSNSAMMVLGVIAKNQAGSEFATYMGERLVEQLKQTSQTSRQVSILAALGNSGNAEQQDQIAPFLTASEPKLRQQAADSLGKMPNEKSLKYITEQLGVETDKDTKASLLRAMGNNELDNQQINGLFSYSQSQPREIRLASIQALAAQTKTDPDLKPRLKTLIKGEKDQQVLRALMQAVYSN